jgi:hypothetical protein
VRTRGEGPEDREEVGTIGERERVEKQEDQKLRRGLEARAFGARGHVPSR